MLVRARTAVGLKKMTLARLLGLTSHFDELPTAIFSIRSSGAKATADSIPGLPCSVTISFLM